MFILLSFVNALRDKNEFRGKLIINEQRKRRARRAFCEEKLGPLWSVNITSGQISMERKNNIKVNIELL